MFEVANSVTVTTASVVANSIHSRLQLETALIAQRLENLLRSAITDSATSDGMCSFLQQRSALLRGGENTGAVRSRGSQMMEQRHPLDRLIDGFALQDLEALLVILAGLAEEHEGFAAVLRSLHPRSEPWATVGLAARLLTIGENGEDDREPLRRILVAGAAVASGVLRLTGEAPFFERSLCLADGLWPALHGIERWPAEIEIWGQRPTTLAGLQEWMDKPPTRRALNAIAKRERSTVLLSGGSDEALMWRGLALVSRAQRRGVGIVIKTPEAARLQTIQIHSIVRDCVPVILLPDVESGPQATASSAFAFTQLPDTAVVCTRNGNLTWTAPRPLIALAADTLGSLARRHMWEQMLPSLQTESATLAARFPMEPAHAELLASDLRAVANLDRRAVNMDDFLLGVRARAGLQVSSAIKLVTPKANWNDLVVPNARLEQLQEAVSRLRLQLQVLDEWGFLKARTGSRGVRMLFTGPSGTGKTLSAEVMAHALGVDLLVVDLSRVVSKWIGETEKNLSNVFDSAERAQAVLFFDEADALFGKRTEVSDAHDRYANLETAYLLQRLERFDGLAIMATNLKQNIDSAFMRRLEFCIEFSEPNREQRHRLWSTHIPTTAPLAADVNLQELASLYPVTGGIVRNAAVSAAFLAATEGTEITRHHLVRAVRREYEKAGRAFPGTPAGVVA